MTDAARDYSETLSLPKTDFPMRAGLPQKEPEILARWRELGLYQRLRRGRARQAEIHPARRPALRQRQHPYRARAQQDPQGRGDAQPADAGLRFRTTCPAGTAMACRSNGRSRRSIAPRARTRTRCRWSSSAASAAPSPSTGSRCSGQEFKRLGVEGDWAHPYSTMDYAAEAQIARELMKFAANGTLYRGSSR